MLYLLLASYIIVYRLLLYFSIINYQSLFSRLYSISIFIYITIDPQIDFHEGGSLAVPGALEDSKRIAKMIDDYGSHIHEIYVSLDSHYPNHIAHAISWRHKDYYRNEKDLHQNDKAVYDTSFNPENYTKISHQDVVDGIYNLFPIYIIIKEYLNIYILCRYLDI